MVAAYLGTPYPTGKADSSRGCLDWSVRERSLHRFASCKSSKRTHRVGLAWRALWLVRQHETARRVRVGGTGVKHRVVD